MFVLCDVSREKQRVGPARWLASTSPMRRLLCADKVPVMNGPTHGAWFGSGARSYVTGEEPRTTFARILGEHDDPHVGAWHTFVPAIRRVGQTYGRAQSAMPGWKRQVAFDVKWRYIVGNEDRLFPNFRPIPRRQELLSWPAIFLKHGREHEGSKNLAADSKILVR